MSNADNKTVRSSRKIYSTLILVVFLSFALQKSLQYNFDASNRHYYDIIYAAPVSLITVTTWYALIVFLLLYKRCNNYVQNVFMSTLLAHLSLMPYLMEIAATPQSIWARDVYLHGQIHFLDLSGRIEELTYAYERRPSLYQAVSLVHQDVA